MAQYKRLYIPGGQYFFTSRLIDRQSDLLIQHLDRLRHAVRVTLQAHPFTIDAAVVLPDCTHMIWTLPPEDADFSLRWRMIKSNFSRGLPPAPNRNAQQIERGEKGIWQRRFWEHHIRDKQDLDAHKQFIYAAPVQAGLCAKPTDWLPSSIHRDKATAPKHPYGALT